MTIEYYQLNAQDFYANTVEVDMTSIYQKFFDLLPQQANILDVGCGSGRDTKAFIERGYHVDAFDGSSELVALASKYTGIDVKHQLFEEFDSPAIYDGIWACASLLHVKKSDLLIIMNKLAKSLIEGGVWYLSFKHGTSERESGKRFFTDLTEDTLKSIIEEIPQVTIKETWLTKDKRPDRTEVWLNCLLVKE